ncbi:unnamed protein product [Clonostachys solani]|uniref:F-box domain-containing protein n=1 Tax=Clonostachys solani TaxID=160281 RepID=A0A9N9Z0G9_9HYPO|nr:unnamed protein product [Clonostachys solani]
MQQSTVPRDSSCLQHLPVELQTAVLSHFTSPSDQPTLQAVLLTCKSLNHAALPLSVRTFRNTDHRHGGGFCSERRNAQFLRYILSTRPELAIFVENMIFGQFSSDPNMGYDTEALDEDEELEGDRLLDEYSSEELAIYRKHIVNALSPSSMSKFAEEWVKDLELGCSDAQIALILMSCPNLRSIYFETPYHQRHFLRALEFLNKTKPLITSGLKPALSRLRHIYCETQSVGSPGGHPGDRNPGAFFQLDALHSFEGFDVSSGNEVERFFNQLPAKSSNVEEITLRGSYVSPRVLQSMMRVCKAVKSLEITRGIYPGPVEELLPGHVLASILPHADSLEYLHLNVAEEFQLGVPTQGEHLCLGLELRNMTCLKSLVTGMRSLTGFFNGYTVIGDTNTPARIPRVRGAPNLADCLPPNLESLEIHRCGEDILDQVQTLILEVQEGRSFRRLKCLRLLFDREDVNPDKVRLSFDPALIRIDIVFQSLQNRLYDLIPSYRKGDMRVDAISSPIYAHDLRKQWLAIRGRDIGCASTDLELYEAPGIIQEPGLQGAEWTG